MCKEKLLVIVGPTAVGKTALSIHLAERYQGEIISSDASQVYRMMDIGTAKITLGEMKEIQHHLIDVHDPDHPFSVEEYQRLAKLKINELHDKKILPILVGGTGLYVDAVTQEYSMPHVPANIRYREELIERAKDEGSTKLHQELKEIDPVSAEKIHPNDLKRIIRGLEVFNTLRIPVSEIARKGPNSPYDILWIGITMPRELLYERINDRVDQMISLGLVDEVKSLKEKGYHINLTSMQAIGYKEIMSYLEGEIPFDDSVELIKKRTRRYAKRQLTWFRRNEEIHWFDITRSEVYKEIEERIEGKFFL